jgi:hypothetical protein
MSLTRIFPLRLRDRRIGGMIGVDTFPGNGRIQERVASLCRANIVAAMPGRHRIDAGTYGTPPVYTLVVFFLFQTATCHGILLNHKIRWSALSYTSLLCISAATAQKISLQCPESARTFIFLGTTRKYLLSMQSRHDQSWPGASPGRAMSSSRGIIGSMSYHRG